MERNLEQRLKHYGTLRDRLWHEEINTGGTGSFHLSWEHQTKAMIRRLRDRPKELEERIERLERRLECPTK